MRPPAPEPDKAEFIADIQARRSYPQTSVITQSHLSSLLLASPTLASLPSPSTTVKTPQNSSAIAPSSDSSAAEITVATDAPALVSVLEKLPAGKAFIGGGIETATATAAGGLPPLPPKIGKKWVPQPGGEIPHAPDAYWPLIGYV